MVGDGSLILFWHDKWIEDNSLKSLYPQLFVCSANMEACIFEVLSPLVGDNDRVWSLRFYREFNDLGVGCFLFPSSLHSYLYS